MLSQAPGAGGFLQGVNFSDGPPAERYNNSLHALTIFMLDEWCEDGETINGVRVDKVELCALVMEVKDGEYGNGFQMRLHDMTSECWCSYPGVHECDPQIISDIRANVGHIYIRAFGKWQVFSQKEKQFQIYSVRKVEDPNELTWHMAKVCKCFLLLTMQHGDVPGENQQGGHQANNGIVGAVDDDDVAIDDDELTPEQAKVREVIRELSRANTEIGADISDIFEHSSLNGIDANQIRKIVADLTDNGIIYSTTDEDHFQVA